MNVGGYCDPEFKLAADLSFASDYVSLMTVTGARARCGLKHRNHVHPNMTFPHHGDDFTRQYTGPDIHWSEEQKS
jgi:hypothetical protein